MTQLYIYQELKLHPSTLQTGKKVYKCKGRIKSHEMGFYEMYYSTNGEKVIFKDNYEGDKITE